MSETKMPENWEEDFRVISTVSLAYAIAALAMQVFSITKTHPDSDKSLRALLRRVAPPDVSDLILNAAEDAVKIALEEVIDVQRRTSINH